MTKFDPPKFLLDAVAGIKDFRSWEPVEIWSVVSVSRHFQHMPPRMTVAGKLAIEKVASDPDWMPEQMVEAIGESLKEPHEFPSEISSWMFGSSR